MKIQAGDKVVLEKTETRRWRFVLYRDGQCLGPIDKGGYSRKEAGGKIVGLRRAGAEVDVSAFELTKK